MGLRMILADEGLGLSISVKEFEDVGRVFSRKLGADLELFNHWDSHNIRTLILHRKDGHKSDPSIWVTADWDSYVQSLSIRVNPGSKHHRELPLPRKAATLKAILEKEVIPLAARLWREETMLDIIRRKMTEIGAL